MKNKDHAGRNGNSFVSLQEFIESGRMASALRFAFRLTGGNIEESRELVQETCYRVLWHWANYDPKQSLEGWFFSILKNIFRDSRKNPERHLSLDHPMTDVDGTCLSHADLFHDGDSDILERLEQEETMGIVQRAMMRIAPSHRDILALRALGNRSYEEISDIEDIPTGTVRSRLSRARQLMQKHLGQMEVAP